MSMKTSYFTGGPAPIWDLGNILGQIEAQGWAVRHVLFGGIAQASRLTLPGQQPAGVPVYFVVGSKRHKDVAKLEAPKIVLPSFPKPGNIPSEAEEASTGKPPSARPAPERPTGEIIIEGETGPSRRLL